MKKFRYVMPIALTVVLGLSAVALAVFGAFRLAHLLEIGNTVSFFPLGDVLTCAVISFVLVLIVLALLRSGYYFSNSLKAVLGVTVFRISYDKIESLVRLADGSLYITVLEDKDVKTRVRISISARDEGDFLSALRERKNDIILEIQE